MHRSQWLVEVQKKFRSPSRTAQQLIREHAQFDHDSKFWQRGRIVFNLVRGHRPCDICRHLLCSGSTVTRDAQAFVADGLTGLKDGRINNGMRKTHESEEEFLMQCATGSPQDYSWDRPTWTLVERVWKDLHAHITRNHSCTSIEELMDNVRTYIQSQHQKLELILA